MTTPQTDPASLSRGPSQTNGSVGEDSTVPPSSEYVFNISPAVAPLSFHTTSTGSNDRVGRSDIHHIFNQHSTQTTFIPHSHPSAGPRRGSFPDTLPDGHTPPPPINNSLLSLRGGMSNMPGDPISGPDDAQTDSDPEFRYSTPASRTGRPPRSASNATLPDTSTIVVNGQDSELSTIPNATAVFAKSSGSRRNKQYVLPDGSVVSGKGLGRGRPGIKRGPRKSQPGEQASPSASSGPGADVATPTNGTAGQKRKSVTSESVVRRGSTADSVESGSVDSSEEYNPTAHTRSGRQIQKPTSITNANIASASPSVKLSRNNSTIITTVNSPVSIKTHPKIKRRVYRGREQLALCEHCLRGYGPPGNVIVFCDACNKCWHQRCHEPQISKQTVADSKAEWYCSDCDRILHGKKKDKKANATISLQSIVVPPPPALPAPAYAGPLVGGRFIRPEQKMAYLKTLSKEELVSRLLHAADLAPDLPIFQALVPPPPPPVVMPQAQFTSSYVTPVSKVPSFGGKEAAEDDEVDEGYDGYYDEHAALYPKPGHGLQLPPESEDLHMLLEGKDSRTFSHWQRSIPGPLFSGSGNITSARH